jgi:hypothetical protein
MKYDCKNYKKYINKNIRINFKMEETYSMMGGVG